ncbi:MAG TPA: hypothetical protein VGA56_01220, partial [Opitutaceae bacterium]
IPGYRPRLQGQIVFSFFLLVTKHGARILPCGETAVFPLVLTVKYSLRVHGLPTRNGTIPVQALLDFLTGLTHCAEKGLRLVVEGASVRAGRPPAWLEAATNFALASLGRGSTILEIEAPTLGDLLGDQVRQCDFWLQPPEPDETALSVVSKSIRDTTAENLESDYYDAGVLKSILELKSFFRGREQRVELASEQRPEENILLSVQTVAEFAQEAVREAPTRNWLQDIWGQWPDDEPVESLLRDTKR